MWHLHVSAKRHFVECQPTLGMDSAESTEAINYEAIFFDRRLETLQTTP